MGTVEVIRQLTELGQPVWEEAMKMVRVDAMWMCSLATLFLAVTIACAVIAYSNRGGSEGMGKAEFIFPMFISILTLIVYLFIGFGIHARLVAPKVYALGYLSEAIR